MLSKIIYKILNKDKKCFRVNKHFILGLSVNINIAITRVRCMILRYSNYLSSFKL